MFDLEEYKRLAKEDLRERQKINALDDEIEELEKKLKEKHLERDKISFTPWVVSESEKYFRAFADRIFAEIENEGDLT